MTKKIIDRKEFSLSLAEVLLQNEALQLITEAEPNILIAINITHIWNDSYEILNNKLHNPFYYIDIENVSLLNRLRLYNSFFKLLLAKKQYHTAYNYFQQEEWQLKDRFKPLYYATLHFLRDEYPTDYLRMGPELKETVDDVLAEVAQMAIDYA